MSTDTKGPICERLSCEKDASCVIQEHLPGKTVEHWFCAGHYAEERTNRNLDPMPDKPDDPDWGKRLCDYAIPVTPLRVGWECPRCGAINAPFVTQCTCRVGGIPTPGDVPYSPYRPIGPAPWGYPPTTGDDPFGPGRMAPHTTCQIHT